MRLEFIVFVQLLLSLKALSHAVDYTSYEDDYEYYSPEELDPFIMYYDDIEVFCFNDTNTKPQDYEKESSPKEDKEAKRTVRSKENDDFVPEMMTDDITKDSFPSESLGTEELFGSEMFDTIEQLLSENLTELKTESENLDINPHLVFPVEQDDSQFPFEIVTSKIVMTQNDNSKISSEDMLKLTLLSDDSNVTPAISEETLIEEKKSLPQEAVAENSQMTLDSTISLENIELMDDQEDVEESERNARATAWNGPINIPLGVEKIPCNTYPYPLPFIICGDKTTPSGDESIPVKVKIPVKGNVRIVANFPHESCCSSTAPPILTNKDTCASGSMSSINPSGYKPIDCDSVVSLSGKIPVSGRVTVATYYGL